MKRPGLVPISCAAGSMNSTIIEPHFSLPFSVSASPSTVYPPESTRQQRSHWQPQAYSLQCPHLSKNGSLSFHGVRTLVALFGSCALPWPNHCVWGHRALIGQPESQALLGREQVHWMVEGQFLKVKGGWPQGDGVLESRQTKPVIH